MSYLVNRKKGQKRVEGLCWCCNGPGKVRPCRYWASGIVENLCAKCERTQPVLKPSKG